MLNHARIAIAATLCCLWIPAIGQRIELANGDVYEGEWKDDMMHGQGIYDYVDGRKYLGEWKCGKQDGQGSETWPNNDTYEGQYK